MGRGGKDEGFWGDPGRAIPGREGGPGMIEEKFGDRREIVNTLYFDKIRAREERGTDNRETP